MKKITKVLIALLFAFSITININAESFVPNPLGDIPVGKAKLGSIKVVIENTTDTNISPNGVIVDALVDLYEDDSMMNLIARATNQETIEFSLGAYGEISKIAGIEGIYPAGWMVFLNDWSIHLGATEFTTNSTHIFSNGDLKSGDVIKVAYSTDFGPDVNAIWGINNKNLSSILFSKGELDKTFSSDKYTYDLLVESSDKEILITPSAMNKNFMCRIFIGEKEYSRNELVSIEENDIVNVICGDPAWPSMNNGAYGSGGEDVLATTYSFKVKYSDSQIIESVVAKDANLPTTGQDSTLILILISILASSSIIYYTTRRN